MYVPDEYNRCILFHFYIKPQLRRTVCFGTPVVSYSISTSNHNIAPCVNSPISLYLIPFLHQTTTPTCTITILTALYLIPFLHQTTTVDIVESWFECCILFHFYIKPQLFRFKFYCRTVVSYSISTSNHNLVTNVRTCL